MAFDIGDYSRSIAAGDEDDPRRPLVDGSFVTGRFLPGWRAPSDAAVKLL